MQDLTKEQILEIQARLYRDQLVIMAESVNKYLEGRYDRDDLKLVLDGTLETINRDYQSEIPVEWDIFRDLIMDIRYMLLRLSHKGKITTHHWNFQHCVNLVDRWNVIAYGHTLGWGHEPGNKD